MYFDPLSVESWIIISKYFTYLSISFFKMIYWLKINLLEFGAGATSVVSCFPSCYKLIRQGNLTLSEIEIMLRVYV